MNRIWASVVVLMSAMVLTGCGLFFKGGDSPDPVEGIPAAADFSLADLLDKPRAELAHQAKEIEDRIDKKLDGFRQGHLEFALLHTARISRDAPVFRDATFQDKLGFSLPAYA